MTTLHRIRIRIGLVAFVVALMLVALVSLPPLVSDSEVFVPSRIWIDPTSGATP